MHSVRVSPPPKKLNPHCSQMDTPTLSSSPRQKQTEATPRVDFPKETIHIFLFEHTQEKFSPEAKRQMIIRNQYSKNK